MLPNSLAPHTAGGGHRALMTEDFVSRQRISKPYSSHSKLATVHSEDGTSVQADRVRMLLGGGGCALGDRGRDRAASQELRFPLFTPRNAQVPNRRPGDVFLRQDVRRREVGSKSGGRHGPLLQVGDGRLGDGGGRAVRAGAAAARPDARRLHLSNAHLNEANGWSDEAFKESENELRRGWGSVVVTISDRALFYKDADVSSVGNHQADKLFTRENLLRTKRRHQGKNQDPDSNPQTKGAFASFSWKKAKDADLENLCGRKAESRRLNSEATRQLSTCQCGRVAVTWTAS